MRPWEQFGKGLCSYGCNGGPFFASIASQFRRPKATASETIEKQKANADRVRNQVARTLIINGVIFFLCQTTYRLASKDFTKKRANYKTPSARYLLYPFEHAQCLQNYSLMLI